MKRLNLPLALFSIGGFLGAIAIASFYWLSSSQPALAEPVAIEITTTSVAWDPGNPRDTNAGALTYIAGLELTSDHPDFGGLSGLIVSEDGEALIAVTDQGKWVTADILSEDGRPSELDNAIIAPIVNTEGVPLSGKRQTDAEGLAVAASGDPRTSPTLVAFERNHRLQEHDLSDLGFDAPARDITDFGAFDNLENNGGLEAIALLPDGSLLAISESTFDEDGHIIGARLTDAAAVPVRLKQHLPYALTDMALLPNGDLITLERHYSPLAGVSMMMRRIPAEALDKNEPLDGEVLVEANHSRSIDNMEGLSVREDDAGRTLLYLVSDDNFNAIQRTLLLIFALDG